MSGIGIAVAGGVDAVASSPFVASIALSNASTTFFVSGASGDLYSEGFGVIVVLESGGTAPYGGSGVLENDPSGKLSIVAASDGVHNTVAWAGFAVNEVQGFNLQFDGTDNVGATSSSRYPSSGSITIKRTS